MILTPRQRFAIHAGAYWGMSGWMIARVENYVRREMRRYDRMHNDWVVCIDNGFKCLRCGDEYIVNMPVSITIFLATGEAFTKDHRHCTERT